MSSELYRFGSYQLDVRRSRLMRDGAEVALRPKAFDLLHHLLRGSELLELGEVVAPGLHEVVHVLGGRARAVDPGGNNIASPISFTATGTWQPQQANPVRHQRSQTLHQRLAQQARPFLLQEQQLPARRRPPVHVPHGR